MDDVLFGDNSVMPKPDETVYLGAAINTSGLVWNKINLFWKQGIVSNTQKLLYYCVIIHAVSPAS